MIPSPRVDAFSGVAMSLFPVFVRCATSRRCVLCCELARKKRRGSGDDGGVAVARPSRHNHAYAFRYSTAFVFLPPLHHLRPHRATRTSLYTMCINYNAALHGRVARAKEIGFPARAVKRNYVPLKMSPTITARRVLIARDSHAK